MGREQTNEYNDEAEKIDLIDYLYEFMKAFRKFFWLVFLIIIICMGGSCFWSWRNYQPVYAAYASFVVTSSQSSYNTSYYNNTTAEQLGKTFPYILTSGVLKDVVAEDLGYSFDSSIEATVMEGTNLFTITVQDDSPQTAYDVLTSVIENYPQVAEYIIGGTTLTVVDESGVLSRTFQQRRFETVSGQRICRWHWVFGSYSGFLHGKPEDNSKRRRYE